jgi:hypothetical protein
MIMAVGIDNRSLVRPIEVLTDALGASWCEFAGGHLGFIERPELFAAGLHAVATEAFSRVDGLTEEWRAPISS